MPSQSMKRLEMDSPDSTVLISFPVSRDFLSEKSKFFQDYFCDSKTKSESRENQDHLFLDNFSFKSYLKLFTLMLEEEERNVDEKFTIDWELVQLAEKHQNKVVFDHLMNQVDILKIVKENVIDTTKAALRANDLEFCAELPKKILELCIKAVHNQEINLLENGREEEDYKNAILYLSTETKELPEKSKMDVAEVSEHINSSTATEKDSGSKHCTTTEEASSDEISVDDLDKDMIYITYPLSKKMLAKKSPVFQSQFCGPLRKKISRENTEYLNLTEYSPEAYAEFFALLSENFASRYEKILGHCGLYLELLLLADMYQVQDIFDKLIDSEENLIITNENVVFTAIPAIRFKDLSVTEALCKRILKKCVLFIHFNQVNIWDNIQEGDDYKDAVFYLASQLNDLREMARSCEHGVQCQKCAKKELCKNCGTLPCLDGERVEIMSSRSSYWYTIRDIIKIKSITDYNNFVDYENNSREKRWLSYDCS